jgi:hypothetical protein
MLADFVAKLSRLRVRRRYQPIGANGLGFTPTPSFSWL